MYQLKIKNYICCNIIYNIIKTGGIMAQKTLNICVDEKFKKQAENE